MGSKRERLQVIKDILNAIKDKNGRIKPTHILYKANLSHSMMNQYLNELITGGFITEEAKDKGKTYSLTQKGFEFLSKYHLMVDFVDSFGLKQE